MRTAPDPTANILRAELRGARAWFYTATRQIDALIRDGSPEALAAADRFIIAARLLSDDGGVLRPQPAPDGEPRR